MSDRYDCLKLKSQLCFPLYACSKEIIRRYKPFLDEVDLTYTQYITMMALWENKSMNVRELGLALFLDSGTLTPVLKKLENKGYLERKRSKEDERNLIVSVTEKGWELREEALSIPQSMSSCVNLEPQEAGELYRLLYKILGGQNQQASSAGTGRESL
ncbi:MAG: MarR family transcriptional regulator [Lachnospiraceae bacterium]|nr:MarR family transcriptional regulator [Lachnospiraceae bacterium]